MARFFDNVTQQPVTAVYISSSRKGYVMVQAGKTTGMQMRSPAEYYRVMLYGPGKVKRGVAVDADNAGDSHWYLSDLAPGTDVVLWDEKNSKEVQKIKVYALNDLPSYKEILLRIGRRALRIDLDSFIDFVYWASPELNEGVYFRPASAQQFEDALKDTRQFHHDDRRDKVAGLAAFATVGKGYREISSPSLHIAVADRVCSVHIDSFAFILSSPYGGTEIGPDALQHILDELVLRLPMAWFRRKGLTWAAAIMQTIHILLPNSHNNFSPKLGLRIEFGRRPDQNWMTGTPDVYLESYFDFSTKQYTHELGVNIVTGGPAHRRPDWVLTAKAKVTCPDASCSQHQEMVGLFLRSP